jgi:hypothetical protein
VTVATRRPVFACLLAAALLLVAAGCDGKTAKKKAKKAAGGASAPVVVEEKLPDINADSALTVDGGRLAVSSPQGWARGPRSKDYLVRYTPAAQKTYPSITVTSTDPPAGFTEVTPATQAIAAGLAETFTEDGKSTLVKQPAAVTIGSHLGVAYAAPGRAKVGSIEEAIDRSFLAIVVNGRLVTVEARAAKGKLDDKGRLTAKAVAAAISAPKPAEPPPALESGTESAPAEPAATPPSPAFETAP